MDCGVCRACSLPASRGCTGGDNPRPAGPVERPWLPDGWGNPQWRQLDRRLAHRRFDSEPMYRCPKLLATADAFAWIELGVDAVVRGFPVARDQWTPVYRDVVRAVSDERRSMDTATAAVVG